MFFNEFFFQTPVESVATKPPTETIPNSSDSVHTNPQTEVVLHPVVQREITYICEVKKSILYI